MLRYARNCYYTRMAEKYSELALKHVHDYHRWLALITVARDYAERIR